MAHRQLHRYTEDPARCAEILRLALPLMARQAAGAHPLAYAVWFEHLSGRNPRLSEAIAALTKDGGLLDEVATAQLYREFVAEVEQRTAMRMTDGIQRVIGEVAQSASDAGDQSERYGRTLDRLSAGVSPDHDPPAELLLDVLEQTRVMRDAVGHLRTRLEASQKEVEHLRNEVDRARSEALVDALTGLPNRRAFDRLMAAALAGPGSRPCLVVADIDHFKRINDTHGHLFGDTVLKVIANAFRNGSPPPCTVARVGGEEFAILLPATALDKARELAERVRAAVAASRIKRKDRQETVGQVTVSFGVAACLPGETPDDWFERADRALYISKANGRNRVTVADDRPAGASRPVPVA